VNNNMKLEDKLRNLPDQPGVYLMLDAQNEIIYVGKARNLKNRVRQYFHSEDSQSPKVRAMMQRVADFDTIITDTEVESLILECNLIKENRPRYNILLRDDKSYPYIKVTVREDFPRVIKTRNFVKDGSMYFGPFTDAGAVNDTLELIRRMYPLKSCSKKINAQSGRIERPCLNFHIRKCLGPCRGKTHQEEYLEMIQQVIMLLNGKQTQLQQELQQKMKTASEQMRFEAAADLRDQLQALGKITEKQKMDTGKEQNQDIIAAAMGEFDTFVQVFTVRDGKIIRQHHHLLKTDKEEEISGVLTAFIKLFYDSALMIPAEIIVEQSIEDQNTIEDWLSEKRGAKVNIKTPVRGEKKKLVELVKRNALIQLEQREAHRLQKEQSVQKVLGLLQELAGLEALPVRIESVDISHTSGVESVGALVVFENGMPAKKHYRKYRIRGANGPDDTGSIKEVLTRRFHRGIREAQEIVSGVREYNPAKDSVMPDLLLIDGGAGQVSTAEKVLTELQLDVPVMGMVKDEKHRSRWLLSNGKRYDLKESPPLWRLVTAIQDETHRFAVSFHHQRRSKSLLQSVLTEIPGVGEKRRRELMMHFKNMENLRKATPEELSSVQGISAALAEKIAAYLKNKQ
jgi:excinuclease ABC subunit C